ncbi:MAG: SCO family protein, partial [Sphingobacteriaceae bacterium]
MKKLAALILPVLLLAACTSGNQRTLPIYGERETVINTVNGQQVTDTVYHTIPAFSFVNQYGDSVTEKSLEGKIYVADFFFTSCPSICP